MSRQPPRNDNESWVDAELRDNLDEELELEIDDERVADELREVLDFARELG